MADEKKTSVAPVEEAKTKKEKTAAKPKAKKGGLIQKFREVKSEFKKIIWPTLPAVVRNTLVTLAMCVLVGVVVFVIDFALAALVDLMLSLG